MSGRPGVWSGLIGAGGGRMLLVCIPPRTHPAQPDELILPDHFAGPTHLTASARQSDILALARPVCVKDHRFSAQLNSARPIPALDVPRVASLGRRQAGMMT